jgi:plastocyanin
VQYAVVWLEVDTAAIQDPGEVMVSLDQQACEFAPHVLVVPLGGRVAIRNSDPVVHNLRIFRDSTRVLEEWQQPRAKETLFWEAKEPGRYLIRCGVHPWMYAWVVVGAHRFFGVTNPTGKVIMPDVPPGRYTLRVWHETLGEAQRDVTIGQQPTTVTIRLMNQHNNERRSS